MAGVLMILGAISVSFIREKKVEESLGLEGDI
jgi:hypothetical protein